LTLDRSLVEFSRRVKRGTKNDLPGRRVQFPGMGRTEEFEGASVAISDLLATAREVAYEGLRFSKDPYDLARYETLAAMVAAAYATVVKTWAPGAIDGAFESELGVLTPKVGVDAVIFDDEERLLLHRREDDQAWALPGGWLGATEIPETGVVREVREETGLRVAVVALVQVWSRSPSDRSPFASIHLTYECLVRGGKLVVSHESEQLQFCAVAEVDVWHRDHRERVEQIMNGRESVGDC
jgi:ADP-ribose pyrophosphatase YjhB (NUDIX family)